MDKDELCYQRYLSGDEEGLRQLIDRYGDNLTFYINGYLHDLNESEDLMLEAFSRLLAKPRKFNERTGSFKAYLFKIAHNLALRYLARHWQHHYFNLDDLAKEPVGTELLENILCDEDRNRTLHAAMDALNAQYREVLYLIYFENMTYANVAKILRKNEKQISNLAYRGRQALRSILEKGGMTHAND